MSLSGATEFKVYGVKETFQIGLLVMVVIYCRLHLESPSREMGFGTIRGKNFTGQVAVCSVLLCCVLRNVRSGLVLVGRGCKILCHCAVPAILESLTRSPFYKYLSKFFIGCLLWYFQVL